jgi:predicted membrane channel-forming protein YqfA (hemolysin III family)
MFLWLFVALVAYLVGVIVQWLELKQEFREMDEYNHFPIVWATQVVLTTGCFLEALAWPYNLMLDHIEDNQSHSQSI